MESERLRPWLGNCPECGGAALFRDVEQLRVRSAYCSPEYKFPTVKWGTTANWEVVFCAAQTEEGVE